jgi:predicted P-loop ATPase
MSRKPGSYWLRSGETPAPGTPGRKKRGATAPPDPAANGNGADHAGAPLGYGEPTWMLSAHLNRQGNLLNNLHNATLVLGQDQQFKDLLGFDEMDHAVVVQRPVGGLDNPLPTPAPLCPDTANAIQRSLQRLGLRNVGGETTLAAIESVAMRHRFHPVRDWLDGLTWDGVERIDTWLPKYLGTENTAYAREIGAMFLIAMVARIYEPGCKADYMLVLEHAQGTEKSTVCKILAGERWFSDSLPDLHRGDGVRISMHLRGKWLIEIAEMSAIRAAEASALKAFLTQTIEQFTPKFARVETREPRQCLFIGTTNKGAYLRDETGGRRFWPVKCGTISPGLLADHREQLFAEAVQHYRDQQHWWPTREFEREHIRPQQLDRYEADDGWQEPIAAYLDSGPSGPRTLCTINELADQALKLETRRLGTADQRRITAVLETLGWVRGKRQMTGTPWIKPTPAPFPDQPEA